MGDELPVQAPKGQLRMLNWIGCSRNTQHQQGRKGEGGLLGGGKGVEHVLLVQAPRGLTSCSSQPMEHSGSAPQILPACVLRAPKSHYICTLKKCHNTKSYCLQQLDSTRLLLTCQLTLCQALTLGKTHLHYIACMC